jgi:anthraniloyl-CoA monooxygenase
VLERNKANDTFGWGVVLSDERWTSAAKNDPDAGAPRRSASISPTGTTSPWSPRVRTGLGRARLLRHRAQAAADPAAGRARELGVELRFETEFGGRGHPRIMERSGGGLGRAQLGRARYSPTCSSPTSTCAVQVRLARHASEVRRRLHLHLREDRARLGLGACLPVRRRDRDLHRRMHAGDLGRLRLRRHEPRTTRSPPAERIFAKHLGGHEPDVERAHLRGSAWMNFPRVLCERW